MKKLLIALFVLVSLFSFTGCKKEESTVINITVGISPDYPPYENINLEGEIYGFDVEMVKYFEKYLNAKSKQQYSFELVSIDFNNIITQIQGGQVMIGISGFSYDEERADSVDFSNPYCLSKQVLLVLKDSQYQTVESLQGKKLAAQTGTTSELAALELSEDVASITNAQTMVTGLAANQYDAVVLDEAVANGYLSSGLYNVLSPCLTDEMNYVIVKKGDAEMLALINECIDAFTKSEEYKALCTEYQLSAIK